MEPASASVDEGREFVPRFDAEELMGTPQLDCGRLAAPLVLENENLSPIEAGEEPRELAAVEAALERVIGLHRANIPTSARTDVALQGSELVPQPR
jgi:hypothetical protein